MLALTSCTGKLGGATLSAIIEHNLYPLHELVITTSTSPSDSRWDDLKSKGLQVRKFDFDNPDSKAFAGCTKLLLVSTPKISLDFNNAPAGEGREKHHVAAIKAAREADVKHIYYTSLAFGSDSGADVMRAHLRTEEVLKDMQEMKWTVIREGLYNESWPLYLGYFDPKKDERDEIVLAGDGKISWTSIADLGLATALVVTDENKKWEGRTFYLSKTEGPKTLQEIAEIVGTERGKKIRVRVVSREEYVDYYVGRGMGRANVEWWSSTYRALENGECLIKDRTLDELLSTRGIKPKPVAETAREMVSS